MRGCSKWIQVRVVELEEGHEWVICRDCKLQAVRVEGQVAERPGPCSQQVGVDADGQPLLLPSCAP